MPKKRFSPFQPSDFQSAILNWYHENHRVLPWRVVGEGETDPYKVWMSEIMLQQTTVPAVVPYFLKFTERWPTIADLAGADDAEVMAAWAGLGYYARARNLLKCARVVTQEWGGQFPQEREGLLSLPGIGPYTAAAMMAIAYGKPATVVDGNIERITARIFAIPDPYPDGKKIVHHAAGHLFDGMERWKASQIKAYPQALMDIGANICTPQKPLCPLCPVQGFCKAHAAGEAEKYPVKAAKKTVPVRHGEVYWIQDIEGNVIFQKRLSQRMLGGMIGLPTTDWDLTAGKKGENALNWQKNFPELRQIGHVYHVFTHFRLELAVWGVVVPDLRKTLTSSADLLIFNTRVVELDKIGLPTLFLKAARLAHKVF